MSLQNTNKSLHFFPLWLSLGIGLVVTVIFLSLMASPPKVVSFTFGDKIGHFLAYAVLMGWFGQIFSGRMALIFFALSFAIMGVSLEYLQGMGPHRQFEYADMVANTIGVVLGLLLTTTVLKGSLHWFEERILAGKIKT